MKNIMHASNKARRGINGVAKAAGLSSAFLAASGFALAADIELNTIILPEHYQSEDDGSIVLTLKSGEKVSLSHDMFVMLDGGLILIVDETAQASLSELPVMGALRTQLLTEKLPVRSPDGGILELAQSKPVWAGEGPVPRLFEEIDIERYELAQSTDGLGEPQIENGAGQVWGLGFAGVAALGSLLTGPRGEVEGAEEAASSSGSTGGGGGGMSPPVTNFWYSTSNGGTVAEGASFSANWQCQ